MDFQKLLLEVDEALRRDEIKALAFLCTDLLGQNLSSVESASEIFSYLEDQDHLSPEKPHLLKELLLTIQQYRLVRQLRLNDLATTSLISPYRKLLYKLSEGITRKMLKNVKFLLEKDVSHRKLEDSVTMLEVFLEMERLDLISDTNLDTLEKIFESVCPMLNGEIKRYKEQQVPNTNLSTQEMSRPRSSSFPSLVSPSLTRTGSNEMRDECEALAQNLSGLHTEARSCPSLEVKHHVLEFSSSQEHTNSSGKQTSQTTNDHTEGLGTYPMTSTRRGICLIINNYDFTKSIVRLKNREGTMVDEKCLQVVFEWLGFEMQKYRDCDKRKILSLVSELSGTDHSQMDCFVFCILSHGLEGGVYGADGQEVKLSELTDPFDGSECPSLANKPKLFFIQACQGTGKQKPVYIEADTGASSRICSGPVKAGDSIPPKADVLLGMATVPLFVSYRNKISGAWFIQSLCHNLVQMVPRECNLLSIMTKVNADVSQKNTGSSEKKKKKKKNAGSHKQMPQLSSSLRMKVVFPVPKTSPPNL